MPNTRAWITSSARATKSRFCRRYREDNGGSAFFVRRSSCSVQRSFVLEDDERRTANHERRTVLMFDKLASEEQRYEDLMRLLGTTEVQSDSSEYRKHAKALAELEPMIERF